MSDDLIQTTTRLQNQLHAVRAINDTLRTNKSLSAIYPVVSENLARAIQFDSLMIGVYDAETDIIRFDYAIDEDVIDTNPTPYPLEEKKLASRVIRGRELVFIEDLLLDPIKPHLTRFGQLDRPSRAWMGSPMISGGTVQGFLSVMSYQPNVFTQDDADMLTLITSQMAIAVENYRLIDRLRQTIMQLSAPLIPVAEGVLVLPLIGQIDEERADRIVQQTLTTVVDRQVSHLLIDITGVDVIDEFTVSQLLKIVQTTALIGATAYIVGMSPKIAQATVTLDIDLSSLQSFRDLQSALAFVLPRKN